MTTHCGRPALCRADGRVALTAGHAAGYTDSITVGDLTAQIIGNEVTNDKLPVNAGGGNDVDVGNEVRPVIGASVDLGAGQR